MDTNAPSLAQKITDQVIEALEHVDANDWKLPWHRLPVRAMKPLNPISGTVYRGINWLVLMVASGGGPHLGIAYKGQTYPSARWATYRQWKSKDCQVRKGEQGTKVVIVKSYAATVTDQDSGQTDATDEPAQERKFMREYTVFAAEQVEGAEAHLAVPAPAASPEAAAATAIVHPLAEQVISASAADIRFGFNEAMHVQMVQADEHWIQMPHKQQFDDANAYYAILFHELVHWTKRIIGRDAYLMEHFENLEHRAAFEELVAELGAAMLCGVTGVENVPSKNHACYIKAWLSALHNEKNFLPRAAAQAQKAVDHLLKLAGLGVEPGPAAGPEEAATAAAPATEIAA